MVTSLLKRTPGSWFIFLMLVIGIPCASAGQVELTTYYPAPTGEYDELESNALRADLACAGATCTPSDTAAGAPSLSVRGNTLFYPGTASTNSVEINFDDTDNFHILNQTSNSDMFFSTIGGGGFQLSAGGNGNFTFTQNGRALFATHYDGATGTGKFRSNPECRVVTHSGPPPLNVSEAQCASDEYLMTGGGGCAGCCLNESRPNGNGWTADCYAQGWGDIPSTAYAVCCKKAS